MDVGSGSALQAASPSLLATVLPAPATSSEREAGATTRCGSVRCNSTKAPCKSRPSNARCFPGLGWHTTARPHTDVRGNLLDSRRHAAACPGSLSHSPCMHMPWAPEVSLRQAPRAPALLSPSAWLPTWLVL
eukprot:scaffold26231_cov29-Tisochrysis_lutea.AAC.2